MSESSDKYPHENMNQALKFIRGKLTQGFKAETAFILGSGLSRITEKITNSKSIPYRIVPGLEETSVPGHQGLLVSGQMNGKNIIVLSGRKHFYEGVSMSKIVFPIRLVSLLGVKKFILVSAVGAINKKYKPGDFVVIKDHINLMGTNPLVGEDELSFGERFLDMSGCYNKELLIKTVKIAKKLKIRLHQGVYTSVVGPIYETPAEIRTYKMMGGDVVGMSMVPEAIAAHQMGVHVLGLCLVTNMASGISKSLLTHEDVLESGINASKKTSVLIEELMQVI